jgi:phosphatidylglycerophosphatase A
MIKISNLIATWFYSGHIRPASGTWGTLAGLPLCLAFVHYGGHFGVIFGAIALFIIGLWAAHAYEIDTGEHDSSRVVIDEVAGMMLACLPLLYQFEIKTITACFIAFRMFDAVKIGPVGWLDRNINGALGVMMDDIAAGLLAAITVFGGLLWMI